MNHNIYFPQFDKAANIRKGKSVLDYAVELGIPVSSGCKGRGVCRECRITVEKGSGALKERTTLENDLNKGERLACQSVIEDDTVDMQVKVSHLGKLEHIAAAGKGSEPELLPLTVRKGRRFFFRGLEIGSCRKHIYGIAADIGTTTVVLHLLDLETGKLVFTSAFENPKE